MPYAICINPPESHPGYENNALFCEIASADRRFA